MGPSQVSVAGVGVRAKKPYRKLRKKEIKKENRVEKKIVRETTERKNENVSSNMLRRGKGKTKMEASEAVAVTFISI